MITRRTQGKSAPTRADKEEASRLQSEPSHQHSSLQPTQERPAWKSLVVTVIVTVSGTSALSDCSHKSLGLDRLQKGGGFSSSALGRRSFSHYTEYVQVAEAKQGTANRTLASPQGTLELPS